MGFVAEIAARKLPAAEADTRGLECAKGIRRSKFFNTVWYAGASHPSRTGFGSGCVHAYFYTVGDQNLAKTFVVTLSESPSLTLEYKGSFYWFRKGFPPFGLWNCCI